MSQAALVPYSTTQGREQWQSRGRVRVPRADAEAERTSNSLSLPSCGDSMPARSTVTTCDREAKTSRPQLLACCECRCACTHLDGGGVVAVAVGEGLHLHQVAPNQSWARSGSIQLPQAAAERTRMVPGLLLTMLATSSISCCLRARVVVSAAPGDTSNTCGQLLRCLVRCSGGLGGACACGGGAWLPQGPQQGPHCVW